jgi:hypothetical protein
MLAGEDVHCDLIVLSGPGADAVIEFVALSSSSTK